MFSRSLHRTSPASVAALLVGIVLIAGQPRQPRSSSTTARSDSRKRALQNEARGPVRAARQLLRARPIAGPDHRPQPGFRNFYAEPGSRAEKIRSRERGRPRLEPRPRLPGAAVPGEHRGGMLHRPRRGRERARREGQGGAALQPVAGRDGGLLLRPDLRPEARRGLPVGSLRVAGHQRMGDRELDSDPGAGGTRSRRSSTSRSRSRACAARPRRRASASTSRSSTRAPATW